MYALLLLMAGPTAHAQAKTLDATVVVAETATPPVQTNRWQALANARRYDALATLSKDPVLTRRLAELRRARFMQQRLHAQYQPRHPKRDSIDDRVRLLEGAVERAVRDVVAARTLSDDKGVTVVVAARGETEAAKN